MREEGDIDYDARRFGGLVQGLIMTRTEELESRFLNAHELPSPNQTRGDSWLNSHWVPCPLQTKCRRFSYRNTGRPMPREASRGEEDDHTNHSKGEISVENNKR